MMLEIFDNFLSVDDVFLVLDYCVEASYNYGEFDSPEDLPTGMTHNIEKSSEIYELFHTKTKHLVDDFVLNRMYINCFASSENPHFHVDGMDGITFIYYANDEWNLEMGGETQFYIDEEIKGVLPYPNRIIMFDSDIIHRATTFREGHRFTLAIKYGPVQ